MKKLWQHMTSKLFLTGGFKWSFILMFFLTFVGYSSYIIYMFGQREPIDIVFVVLICLMGLILVGFLLIYVFEGIKKLPSAWIFYFATTLAMLKIMFDSSKTTRTEWVLLIAVVLFFVTLGYLLTKGKKTWYLIWPSRVMFVLSGIVLAMLFFWKGHTPDIENAFLTQHSDQTIMSEPSKYEVVTGGYGQGKFLEKYKIEMFESKAVSIGSFLGKWDNSREKQLGFNVYDVPLNGLYYMPKAQGNYPLVLVVHGNHEMTHSSEEGYAYLGHYLASRGYIVVSVDENFLNYSSYNTGLLGQSIGNENDARAYVLLEHVRFLLSQNELESSLFYNKINKDNIGLIGHSRGGEAVAIARYFDEINYLPNDFHKKFNYDFNIKSIIAIAPTDQQYKPGNRKVKLTNVNYLLLHGTHDMDVTYFAGINQYERIEYSKNSDAFKAVVYIYGANHGHFNSSWSTSDTSTWSGLFYNKKPLIPREVQEETASLLIYNFLEATLNDQIVYKEGFRDLSAFVDLPENLYQTQYQDGHCQPIVDYNEDGFIETATIGGSIKSQGLSKWSEGMMRLDGKTSDVYGAFLSANGRSGSYVIELDENLMLTQEDVLYLTLGDDTKENDDLINMIVRLEDVFGHVAEVPIARYGYLQHQIEINIPKFYFIEDINNRETILQTFQLPLSWFLENNESMDLKAIDKVSLVFDGEDDYVIFLKEMGIRYAD